MQITYFDSDEIKDRTLTSTTKDLTDYRAKVADIIAHDLFTQPESSLALYRDEKTLEAVYEVAKQFKKTKLVIVVGIGGSSLGTEAIHEALGTEKAELLVLDSIAPHTMKEVLKSATSMRSIEQIAVCVISKSGSTTETLTNAEVLLAALRKKFGAKVNKQFIYIGNKGNNLLKVGKKLKGHTISMPDIVGGRYSVFSAVGLMPLTLLGHDIEGLLNGLERSTEEHYEEAVAESASRLFSYMNKKYRSVNFFAFDTRLQKLGFWYRQLTAESLGKEKDKKKQPVKIGFIPTVSTPVELHSIGQLYFSDFGGVYTDFVHFDDAENDYDLGKKPLIAKNLKNKTQQEIATATFGGVIGAYQARNLPYRSTAFDEDLAYSLGLFMGMRMLETMYIAQLMNVDAFNQPNVELYKDKTRKILGL